MSKKLNYVGTAIDIDGEMISVVYAEDGAVEALKMKVAECAKTIGAAFTGVEIEHFPGIYAFGAYESDPTVEDFSPAPLYVSANGVIGCNMKEWTSSYTGVLEVKREHTGESAEHAERLDSVIVSVGDAILDGTLVNNVK